MTTGHHSAAHRLVLPPEDRDLSPYTGWTREHWVAVAEHLLLSVRPYFSPGRATVDLPGPPSAYGVRSDGLEGFARTLLLAGFLTAGHDGHDPHGFLDWYRQGLLAGTDPAGEERWPRPDELDQAKVEAASIALVLMLTRQWLWDRLSAREQQQVIDWFTPVIGAWYPPINWVWFQIIVEEFLRSAGGPHSEQDVASCLAVHASLARADGWYSDGPERSYDHYVGWALHFYPLVWASLTSDPDQETVGLWRGRLSRYLEDAAHMVGADGGPMLQGRSLIYRTAAATPFWVGAWSGATTLDPGVIRRACSGILRHFVERGAPDDAGLLTLGLHGAWPAMKQSYSGPGSPYWAAKGFFGLVLPPDHAVWRAREEPLPVERGDFARSIRSPGWLLGGTRSGGVVRLVNHGTDHGAEGDLTADSPLYGRLGYSTATMPALVGDTLGSPVDQSVVVLDDEGRASHRTGFTALGVATRDGVAIGGSRWVAHWVDASRNEEPDHGAGRRGPVVLGPTLECWSFVRGADEVRAVTVVGPADAVTCTLRIGGWPVTEGCRACVEILGLAADTGRHDLGDVSPLPGDTTVGWASVRVRNGDVVVSRLRIGAAGPLPEASWEGTLLRVTWPDGATSTHDLAHPLGCDQED